MPSEAWMWRRRDFLRSSVIGFAVGFVSGHAMAGSLPYKREAIALDEAAEVLGAVGAYGGALDALLHGRRELYAVARDQLRAAGDALASMTEAADGARPSAAEDERALVLRHLAAAAGLYAERLDETVRHGVPGAAEGEFADPASGRRARRIAAAARAWRMARGGRNAEIETVLVGPLACALETARFSLRRDTPWKRAVLESYASSFEDGLAGAGAYTRLGPRSDRAALAATARARAAAAEALGLVRGALGEPALV